MVTVKAGYIKNIPIADMSALSPGVLVVLDPQYGEKLTEVWPGRPVWIAMSLSNEPVVRSLWKGALNKDVGDTLTGFPTSQDVGPDISFLRQLDNIELHHGRHSTSDPYRLIEVVGCPLTAEVRAALNKFGFIEFNEQSSGFVASRTEEKANYLR
jgi:hypothetical protein